MAKNTKNKRALIHARQNISEAFESIMLEQLQQLQSWEGKARNWDDIEGVHQTRIALRRMRSALDTFQPALTRELTNPWTGQIRWCNDQLGPARDLDVFISETLDILTDRLPMPGAAKLDRLAHRHRERCYETVNALLDSERYTGFKSGLKDWLTGHAWLDSIGDAKAQKKLQAKITPFARKRLDKLEHKVRKQGNAIDPDSAQAMHQLRIRCKKLRYAAEFFGPLLKKDPAEYIARLKALLSLLGTLNDVGVMQHLLDDLLKQHRDRELLRCAGGLIGWRTHEYYVIKNSFNRRWQQFTAGSLAHAV